MECDPTLSEDVAQLARPWLRVRLLQLVMAVPPSRKVTLPAGVPAPGLLAVTVAVKVTDCLNTDGLAEELADVVVPYFTVCVSLGDVLTLKFASPPYDALIEWEPTASVLVTNVAWPEPFRVPVPRVLVPSLTVTVPVGVPAPGALAVTGAVQVTGCPDADGLIEQTTPVVVPGGVVVVVGAAVVVVVVVVVLVVEDVVAGVVVVVVDVVVVGGAVVVVVVGAAVVVVVVVVGAAVVVVGAAVVVVVLELVVVLLVLVLVELVDVLVDVLVLLLVVVVGITHVPLESQVPPPPHGAPVLGVTVQLDVPLQLRALQVSEVHVIAVPTHAPLPLQVSL